MSKLLALIDGSIYSHSVCDHAAWAAKRMGADVEIMHVLGRRSGSSAPANLSGNLPANARASLLEELADLDEQSATLARKRGRLILDEAKQFLDQDGIPTVAVKLRHGDLIEAVQEFEGDADILVIGKRGEAADFAKLHLGSNLERVVRSSRIPVLVASRAFKPISRVLVAFDGGSSSLKAVDHIARDPIFAGLECHLLMVGSETSELRKAVEDASATLRAGGHEVVASIEPGQTDKVITEKVTRDGIDLLVMGAYSHSRIRSLFIGSTTSEMIRGCLIPILLFR